MHRTILLPGSQVCFTEEQIVNLFSLINCVVSALAGSGFMYKLDYLASDFS